MVQTVTVDDARKNLPGLSVEDGTVREPAFTTANATVYQGHALAVLGEMPDASVDCAVTSPPFWGLRAYGTESQVWAGDPEHEHVWGSPLPPKPGRGNKPGEFSTSALTNPDRQDAVLRAVNAGAFCECGAWRGELGQEPTPDLYVQHLVTIFREVRRVLKAEGTFWLEIGDTYASFRDGIYIPQSFEADHHDLKRKGKLPKTGAPSRMEESYTGSGIKHKDMVGIPWLLAFALRADGWYLRSDIVWARTSAMPESVRDRPTSAWSHVFLLAKSERYFFDAEAVREPLAQPDGANPSGKASRFLVDQDPAHLQSGGKQGRTWDERKARGAPTRHGLAGSAQMGDTDYATPAGGRNIRNVWTLGPEPLAIETESGSHYASFPSEVPRRAILAGTSAYGVCGASGKPYERTTERSQHLDETRPQSKRAMELARAAGLTDEHIAAIQAVGLTDVGYARAMQSGTGKNLERIQALAEEAKAALGGYYREFVSAPHTTTGWEPTCGKPYERVIERGNSEHHHRAGCGHIALDGGDQFYDDGAYGGFVSTAKVTGEWAATCEHGAPVVPSTVLDPFLGSGTTAMVAVSLGRRAIGIELNASYVSLAQRRIAEGEMERSRAGGMAEPLRAETVVDLGPLWSHVHE